MRTLLVIASIVLIWSCTAIKSHDDAVRIRTVDERIAVFHRPVELRIGWRIYKESAVANSGDFIWQVSNDSIHRGLMPVILVSYADTTRNVWLEMTMDDATFGRLIKQSLMTQKPIEKPIAEFLKKSECATCHPSQIKIK